jgi:hypothetical protein
VQELETGPAAPLRRRPNERMPKRAARVYTVWEGGRLLYVGMNGRAMAAEDLEVGAGEHATPARVHEAMLAKA